MPLEEMLILTAPPDRLAQARQTGLTLGHAAYRLGRGGHLYRIGGPVPARGGLMVVDAPEPDPSADGALTCQQILRECAARGFVGVICRFAPHPFTRRVVGRLDDLLVRKKLALYVPESFGRDTRHALVLLSSALSGGSFAQRLEEACDTFGGPVRLALQLDRVAEDFTLPSPTGCGRPLSREELAAQLNDRATCVFFSGDLCARYFTYMSEGSGAHFVLFDDGGSLRKKLQLARRQGLARAVGRLEELDDVLEELIR